MSAPHFVVVTIGSAGDLFPFMRVALALREQGHRVTMLGPSQHGPYVAPTGLDFHGLPADEAVLDHPDLWHPTRGLAVVWRATRPAMAQVPAFVAALPPEERIVLLVHPLALPEADLCRARRVHVGQRHRIDQGLSKAPPQPAARHQRHPARHRIRSQQQRIVHGRQVRRR
ncbi:MAG: hypothetical protein EOP92_13370 [Lysobacteraceae bacterium]|nr:MAG: hypothetical protein EOP92_13370 [Xanthomonadaceae bacterium]